MCLGMLWLVSAGCKSKWYERHAEPAYTQDGVRREGYLTLNVEYLNALHEDLKACYKVK